MIVSSTEIQNNFGKYLMLSTQENIVITRNGAEIARLSALHKTEAEFVAESAEPYRYGGRQSTYEEFLKLTENPDEHYEYIDGEAYLLTSPRTKHQMALTELLVIFYNWFQDKPCHTFIAPYEITLFRNNPEQINVVHPDLMVICDLEENLDSEDCYMGTPALVVEILSEGTRRKDMIKKLDLYMECGVKEYWIVNPFNREVSIYAFDNGDFADNATYRHYETASSFIFSGLTADLCRVFK